MLPRRFVVPAPSSATHSPAVTGITSSIAKSSGLPTMRSLPGTIVTSGRTSAGAAVRGLSLQSITGLTSSPFPPLTDTVTPPSAIAAPLPELPPVAPLSPQLPTQFATGGVAQPNMALSPGASSTSPSESAPSAPGGGGKTLADCMGFWDRETHMTKAEWKAACARTMEDYPSVLR
jgi:hypothetical protein